MTNPIIIPQALKKTLVCFYIELVLDLLITLAIGVMIGIGLVASFSRYSGPQEDDIIMLIVLFILGAGFIFFGIFKLIVVLQLRKQKHWAWIAAIVLSGLNFMSFPYMILGIIKLVGLLNDQVMAWFKGGVKTEVKSV